MFPQAFHTDRSPGQIGPCSNCRSCSKHCKEDLRAKPQEAQAPETHPRYPLDSEYSEHVSQADRADASGARSHQSSTRPDAQAPRALQHCNLP